MNKLTLPPTLSKLLTGSELETSVKLSLSRGSDYYGDPTRDLPFFPEYTGHGVEHVQGVLDAAAGLISPASQKLLAAADAAVLTLAILLHDAAMLLTRDGFLTLIERGDARPLIPEMDANSWAEAWNDYLAEASRWGGRQLRNVFGDVTVATDPEDDFVKYIKPLTALGTPDEWPPKYCKFIGEFLRRHHARLAHEFALAGVQGPPDQEPYRLVEIDGQYADLCGLVARSHNLGLRDTFPYLKSRYHGIVTCYQAHPVYLMVLLRIADYLQVEAARAPVTSLKVRALRNPQSRLEWSAHHSIVDVRDHEGDEEAKFMVARPRDVRTFLRVRSLLHGLQHELDTSWAVLGEVYSRQGKLKNLGIRLRRVHSNLDDIRRFGESVGYLPERFAFETAGAELLTKLVGPLYGDRPEVGIRELLQNAIDAVNERSLLDPRLGGRSGYGGDSEPGVMIRVERNREGECWVTVEDRGIGMTDTILRSYFFRAGASFRESDAWRKTFAPGGTPKVLRSGRFGVGVLAAFLLGDRIDVLTRPLHAGADEALAFSASIEDEIIEVTRAARAEPGTTVSVRISESVYARLKQDGGKEWDWYRWDTPRIVRSIDGSEDQPGLTRLPAPGSDLPEEWHRLETGEFDDMIWTFGRAPRIVCNGLNIGTSASSAGLHQEFHWDEARLDFTLPIKVPCISVCDRSGRFPVNLPRFNIVGHRFPCADELMADATRDYCAFCLVYAPRVPPIGPVSILRGSLPEYPGLVGEFRSQFAFRPMPWFFTPEGSGQLHWPNLSRLDIRTAIVMATFNHERGIPVPAVDVDQCMSMGYVDRIFRPNPAFAISYILGRPIKDIGPHPFFFNDNDGVTLITPVWCSDFIGCDNGQIDLRDIRCDVQKIGGGMSTPTNSVLVWREKREDVGKAFPPPEEIVRAVAEGGLMWAEIVNPRIKHKLGDSVFVRTWLELMEYPVIPYDLDERRRRFSVTFECLGPYVEKWESLQRQGPEEFRRRFHRETRYIEKL